MFLHNAAMQHISAGCYSGWERNQPAAGARLIQTLMSWKRRAADRRRRLGADPNIDALAADMVVVRMHRFGDQHAVEMPRNQRSLTSHIAQRRRIAIGDAKRGGVECMDHHRGLALARLRGRHVVEGSVEEAARGAGL